MLAEAGFREVRGETMRVTIEFASPEEYARFLQDISGSLRKALLDRDPAEGERVWTAIAVAAQTHAGRDGRIRFENEARLAAGTR